MTEVTMIGLDLAKNVFQVHGMRPDGSVAFRVKLSRIKVLTFFAAQPICTVAMEACASAHYWGRELSGLGHDVKLIPPIYVKPFVKRQKNDMADAEAIAEAASRPGLTLRHNKGGTHFWRPVHLWRVTTPFSANPLHRIYYDLTMTAHSTDSVDPA